VHRVTDSTNFFPGTSTAFQQLVVENSYQVPVVVDFWTSWCALMPMLTRLAVEYDGLFLLAKVNIYEEQSLVQQSGVRSVRSVPTVKLFRNGAAIAQFIGAIPELQIRAFIAPYRERI
jgi:putative thioredoxin